MNRPFFRISSRVLNKPPICRVQTDGSFRAVLKQSHIKSGYSISRTAVLAYTKPMAIQQLRHYDNHENSYESEWASVLDGILFSEAHQLGGIELENDNAAIIMILKDRRMPKQEYIKFYYNEILRAADQLDWFAVRWIPRELNHADKLFC